MISVDGNWGEWGEWRTCTKTCKEGKQSRTRECNSPAPQHGGKKCDGEAQESQVCNQNVPCPSEFGFTTALLLFFFSSPCFKLTSDAEVFMHLQ